MTLNHYHKRIIVSFIRTVLIGGFLFFVALPHTSYAAVTSAIVPTPDGAPGALGTQVTQNGNVYDIDGGTIKGHNLFQSFVSFNVGTGDWASFKGPTGIENIVGRITGSQSMIDGGIRSTIQGANLYLLNPHGFLFGENATLDVSGSFHVSTADFLRLGSEEGIFYADPAANSILTTAPPSAFGFLNSNPAEISLQGSSFQVPAGKAMSFVGGGIKIAQSFLWAPGGQINLTSAASPGEVSLSDAAPGAMSFTGMGNITISDSSVLNVQGSNYNTDPAGTIVIKGGKLFFKDTGISAGGNPGGTINIFGEHLYLDHTSVNTATRGAIDHPGTAVEINVSGDVLLTDGSEIASSSFDAGRAGDIRITAAGNIQLGDDDPTSSLYASIGFYGDIGSRAFWSGRGGDVYINADSLTVKNGFFINTAALYFGDAGNVTVKANSLELLDGGSISSNGFGIGSGGIVDIEAADVLISGKNMANVPNSPGIFTGLAAQTGYYSEGGLLKVKATNLQILDGGRISTVLFSTGPGADVQIDARNVVISGVTVDSRVSPSDFHASIDARVSGVYAYGTGGNISIVNADTVQVTNGGFISSSLYDNAPGNAGNISIGSKSLEVSERGVIAASSLFGTGNGGNLQITANDVSIIGAENAPDPFVNDFTGLSTATNVGRGGDLHLTADNVLMTDRGSITSGSLGSGQAGNITIEEKEGDSGSVTLLSGSNIIASAFGSGGGGNVEVTSDSVLISGVHPEPYVGIDGITTLSPSSIASQALGGGSAGDVKITANSLNVLDGARISTETFGSGDGGAIEIHGNSALVSGLNAGLEQFLAEQGLDAAEAEGAASASVSSASYGEGNGGTINVSLTGDLTLTAHGAISAETLGTGQGGACTIAAQNVLLADQGRISSASTGSGNAGDINITAADTVHLRESSITTEALLSDGGNITIHTPYLLYLDDSEITASVGGGPQTTGGNITIDPRYVVLKNSRIVANAFEGMGGNIQIIADTFLADPESVVDASSALGIDGTVDIQAPITNVSGLLSPLPADFVSASALLRERCMARVRGGKYSSFIIGGRDGLPIEPGNFLPGLMY